MNEITRIHIAKVPYDIEINAKKDIERYIKALEAYADDEELLQDIEIRITELLAERGVLSGGIIVSTDVAVIREQLGEPKDFMSEGDIAIGPGVELSGATTRRLYRNIDSAVFGGVLSGIASFFQVNPLWVRIVFIILLLGSFGTVLLLYGVLWIAIPPARTAAEKLQMNGRPVTLSSIRELNEDEPNLARQYERASTARRTIMILVGICALTASIGVLLLTIFTALNLLQLDPLRGVQADVEWAYVSAYILAILAGVLLATLFVVGAYSAFTRKITKRLMIGAVAIIAMGLISFGTAAGLVWYQSWQSNDQIQRNIKERFVELPDNFSAITTLTVDTAPSTVTAVSASVEYIVDPTPRIVLQSLPGMGKPSISIDGTNATISYRPTVVSSSWPQMQPVVKIYGPALESLVVTKGIVAYSANSQSMKIETRGQESSVVLRSGIFGKLTVKASDQSSVSADYVTVEVAELDVRTGANVALGNVRTLAVAHSEACPAGSVAVVTVHSISAAMMQYNGTMITSKTHVTNCGSVRIGDIYNES